MASEVIQILKELVKLPEQGEPAASALWCEERLDRLWTYYQKHQRHNYPEISRYILGVFRKRKDAEAITIILDNLSTLLTYTQNCWQCGSDAAESACWKLDPPDFHCPSFSQPEDQSYRCYDYKALYRFLLNLYDHIQLEFIRWSDILHRNEGLEKAYQSITMKFAENEGRQKLLLEDIGEKTKQFHEKSQSLDKQIQGIYMQIVSILGIFAAILLAFIGGMSFTASTFANISSASFYQVAIGGIICGVVVFNTIAVLLFMVSKMIERPIYSMCRIADLEEEQAEGRTSTVKLPCSSCRKPCGQLKRLRHRYPFIFWVNLILLAGIGLILLGWMFNAEGFVAMLRYYLPW